MTLSSKIVRDKYGLPSRYEDFAEDITWVQLLQLSFLYGIRNSFLTWIVLNMPQVLDSKC